MAYFDERFELAIWLARELESITENMGITMGCISYHDKHDSERCGSTHDVSIDQLYDEIEEVLRIARQVDALKDTIRLFRELDE